MNTDDAVASLETLYGDVVPVEVWDALRADGRPLEDIDGELGDLLDQMLSVIPAPSTIVKFAPGLRPVLKAMSRSEAGRIAANARWEGQRIGVHTGTRKPKTPENPSGVLDVEGANAKLVADATTFDALPDSLQTKIMGGMETLGVTREQAEANIEAVLQQARDRADGGRPAGADWYDEANGVAQKISNDTGMSVDQASGVLAASSVSHDWPSNQMAAEYASRAISDRHAVQVDDLTTRTKTVDLGGGQKAEMTYYDAARAELKGDEGRMMDGKRRVMPSPEELRGKTMDELDPYVAASLIKAQSQMGYKTEGIGGVGPDGKPFNRDGQSLIGPSDTGTGYGGVTYACGVHHMGRAVAIAQGADPNEVLNGHKVRSFYNNIRDPKNQHNDVTVDSHAFSIAMGRRISNSDPEYRFFSGSSVKAEESWTGEKISAVGNSATYGTSGLYSVFADSYRAVGARQTPPMSAREVQAATWTEWRLQKGED